jgi:hypothetical protein
MRICKEKTKISVPKTIAKEFKKEYEKKIDIKDKILVINEKIADIQQEEGITAFGLKKSKKGKTGKKRKRSTSKTSRKKRKRRN